MFVIVVGGGRTGSHLAGLLVSQNHRVQLVEHRKNTLARLHRELPTEVIVEGEGSDPQVLESIGIKEANVVAAVTDDDALAILIERLTRH